MPSLTRRSTEREGVGEQEVEVAEVVTLTGPNGTYQKWSVGPVAKGVITVQIAGQRGNQEESPLKETGMAETGMAETGMGEEDTVTEGLEEIGLEEEGAGTSSRSGQ